ncbi:hypothetical protein [Demequina rhizosphaerae]|uniref:hypothetical protein n=1 Tax=Demequina rhizosphaerae TaxID=1638985 RepID=UPI0007823C5A|nr:hypothetical protein [Demequina rhizosphaerae]
MKRIVTSRGHYYVERPGSVGAVLGSIALGALWFVVVVPAFAVGTDRTLIFTMVATFVLGLPAYLLASRKGARQRSRVAAIIDAREVPGGVHLVVMDTANARHELVVTDGVVSDLERALTRS